MNGSRESGRDPAAALLRLLWAFLGLWVLPGLVADALQRGGLVPVPTSDAAYVELQLLAFLSTAVLLLAFALWQQAAAWRPVGAARVVRSYAPVLLGWAALLVGYLAAMRALGRPVAVQPGLAYFASQSPAGPGFWIVAAGTVVGAPLAEEIVFRGYLHAALRSVLGPRAAVGVGALLFGLLHGLPYALPIAALGLWFGWLRERSGALLPSIFGHALHNAVAVAITAAWPRSLELLYPR